jgi:putative peptide zinc metalloprotease protein
MQDLASGRVLRFNPSAYRVLALMDGVRSLDEIWQSACLTLGDQAPTQDEILGLLTQLHQANVLLTDRKPDLGELAERGQRLRRTRLKQYLANPLSLKLPLFDPDPLVGAIARRVPPAAWGGILLVWLALILFGALLVGMHWDALTADITARVFSATTC